MVRLKDHDFGDVGVQKLPQEEWLMNTETR